MSAASALTHTDLKGHLPLLARGKVRDVYELSPTTLLFVATDRISAYDVIMKNGIPSKGKLLTSLSTHWFNFLSPLTPTHLLSTSFPDSIPADLRPQLEGRSMVVRRLKVFPVEAIVRGYITGSAWAEYAKSGTVHGIKMPEGMVESEKFLEPLFTPSTKAEQGQHDENIHPSKVAEIVGEKYAPRIEALALKLYSAAHEYARSRGIILADTKFEFGVDPETDDIVLVDEVLTPDSSRFWLASAYQKGKPQESYDKQFLRNWLTKSGLRGKEGVEMPEDVAKGTSARYVEAWEMLTGNKWTEASL